MRTVLLRQLLFVLLLLLLPSETRRRGDIRNALRHHISKQCMRQRQYHARLRWFQHTGQRWGFALVSAQGDRGGWRRRPRAIRALLPRLRST